MNVVFIFFWCTFSCFFIEVANPLSLYFHSAVILLFRSDYKKKEQKPLLVECTHTSLGGRGHLAQCPVRLYFHFIFYLFYFLFYTFIYFNFYSIYFIFLFYLFYILFVLFYIFICFIYLFLFIYFYIIFIVHIYRYIWSIFVC